MAKIEVIDEHVIYENPVPNNRSIHGYFPGLVKLPSGDLLAMFAMGEAFEAANVTTVVSRSTDQGRTWQLEGPIHEKDAEHRYDLDAFKPLLLNDGRLLATGYRFHRTDPNQTVANPETDGLRPGDNLFCHSQDEGRSWTYPKVIAKTRPEVVETSGPAVQLASGSILSIGSVFPMWDGTNPSGFVGVVLRSEDNGDTWTDDTLFFKDPKGLYAPSEPRLCRMQDDLVVALFWTTSHVEGKNLPNHLTVSHDGGRTWSEAIDTGIWGQASNLIHWGDDLLLTIHCHREGKDIGLYVRVVDLAKDRWRTIDEANIWSNAPAMKVATYATMGVNLKFGQASLLRMDNGDVLAPFWSIEDGQGRIRMSRLRVEV